MNPVKPVGLSDWLSLCTPIILFKSVNIPMLPEHFDELEIIEIKEAPLKTKNSYRRK